ncbi:MAG: RNA polymerase sigma-54 factor [Candidatus Kapaibacterium sp.]|nr:MAG: RNA polymerase sigma-54 factor [Candidatus Kapabacteria bacterium]
MPKLKIELAPKLQQTLTPQQIQYLKLLQLPTLQLEQYIKQEMEENPMLEEVREEEFPLSEEVLAPADEAVEIASIASDRPLPEFSEQQRSQTDTGESVPGDELGYDPENNDTFDYFTELWKESDSYATASSGDDDESEPFFQRIRDVPTLEDELLEQVHYLDLTESEQILAEQIIGSLDGDGYLRQPLKEVLDEANDRIAERMYERAQQGQSNDDLSLLSLQQAERVLRLIQELDPPGCGSRSLQECLIAQLRAKADRNKQEQLALRVLKEAFDDLARKHYSDIAAKLGTTEEQLRDALEVIRRLNPKPGNSSTALGDVALTIIPDFIVERDEETGELMISLNESSLPRLRLSQAYQQLRHQVQKALNREARQWLHRKREDAKFLLVALQQRKATMLKVMTAIAHLQRRFFEEGPSGLRPLIYKDVADESGLDISTVCRVVNGKYVQTDYGIFELRYFFSESLITDDGEEVSTRIIKETIRQLIAQEPKHSPLSDDKLSKELKKRGYNVARRTVAKYREQLKIPVARLRRQL